MNAESDEEIHRRLMDKLDRAAGRALPPLEPPGKPPTNPRLTKQMAP